MHGVVCDGQEGVGEGKKWSGECVGSLVESSS